MVTSKWRCLKLVIIAESGSADTCGLQFQPLGYGQEHIKRPRRSSFLALHSILFLAVEQRAPCSNEAGLAEAGLAGRLQL